MWSHLGSIAVLLRGVKLVSKCGYQSATRCSNSLNMHLGSNGVLTSLKKYLWKYANTCAQGDTLGGWHIWARVRNFTGALYIKDGGHCKWPDAGLGRTGASGQWKCEDASVGLRPDAGSLSDRTLTGCVRSCWHGSTQRWRWVTRRWVSLVGRCDFSLLDAYWKWPDSEVLCLVTS